MPICICGTRLEGRRRKCDACKKRPGEADPSRRGPAASTTSADTAPAGLHDRGRQLWADLGQALNTPSGQLALEACRLADRLDELDSVIAGKGVLNLLAFRLHLSEMDGFPDLNVTVGFQSVLAEARQQQVTFKTLLAEIAAMTKTAGTASGPSHAPKAGASSPLDELTRRRQAKSTK